MFRLLMTTTDVRVGAVERPDREVGRLLAESRGTYCHLLGGWLVGFNVATELMTMHTISVGIQNCGRSTFFYGLCVLHSARSLVNIIIKKTKLSTYLASLIHQVCLPAKGWRNPECNILEKRGAHCRLHT